MTLSTRHAIDNIPASEWKRNDLPDGRAAVYLLLRGERSVLFRADGFCPNWQDRVPVRNRVRLMAVRLGLRVTINWVGSIQDGEDDRTVWQITRLTG